MLGNSSQRFTTMGKFLDHVNEKIKQYTKFPKYENVDSLLFCLLFISFFFFRSLFLSQLFTEICKQSLNFRKHCWRVKSLSLTEKPNKPLQISQQRREIVMILSDSQIKVNFSFTSLGQACKDIFNHELINLISALYFFFQE